MIVRRAAILAAVALSCPGCERKSSPTITADPSAKSAPSASPAKSETVAIYTLVLRGHFDSYRDPARLRVIDATALPSCGTAATIASSIPTTRAETIATFGLLPTDQLLTPFSAALGVDLLPLGDAIRLLASAPAPGAAAPVGWPVMGLVRVTPIAFDVAQSDALVSYEHWSTPTSRAAYVIHVVRREGAWFEQEILSCR